MASAQIPRRKLMVEICNAKNLMPKDGQGTASAYVQADFDGQRRRTATVHRNLNPQWNERLEFLIHDSDSMASQTLELNLYNKASENRSAFLGKVKIAGNGFAEAGSESLVYYPLAKRSVFSQIKGEIGVKVWYEEDEPEVLPPPTVEEKKEEETPPQVAEGSPENQETEKKKEDGPPEEEKPENQETEKKKEDGPPEDPKKNEETVPPPAAQPPAVLQKPRINKPMPEKCGELKVVRSISGGDLQNRTFDLVDQMPFLFVRVVKVNRVDPEPDSTAYAKLDIGTHSIRTKSFTPAAASGNRECDQVFAFDKGGLNSTSLEVSVWVEKKEAEDNCIGAVWFDLPEVPNRLPSDSPLAPQWYSLHGSHSLSFPENEVMLSVWVGTQADEAFNDAWQSDSGGLVPETRAQIYLSPKLWYLRLTVIQTQDLKFGSGTSEAKVRDLVLYVRGQLGAQIFKTSRTTFQSSSSASNPTWNEDLIFVAAEPFDPFLTVTVEDAAHGQPVGHALVHVASIDRLADDKSERRSRWFNLVTGGGENKEYAGRIHVKLSLEGGYHVLDEAAHVTSDVRATSTQLAKPPIGRLELGIRGATNLLPVKTNNGARGTTDAYVVAKYGPKWVRTRTIVDRFNPRWNEQYMWEVYDPCTVLTIGVFDNGRYNSQKQQDNTKKDLRLGKLRVRLSTLDTNKVYVGTYSLVVLLPSGAKRMGEIEIALRFTCSSWLSLIQAYGSPVLPRMHYVWPLGLGQQDILKHTAMRLVATRLARSEPALGPEVVQFMLDSDTHIWSVRRGKANWFRVVGCLSKVAALARRIDEIQKWANPATTVLIHVLLVAGVMCPHLILPAICMYVFLVASAGSRSRRNVAVAMDPRMSYLDAVGPDELDEEFDGFPTTRAPDQIRIRYDRLRALAGRAQMLLGDVAAQGERVEALFKWRDARASGIFAVVWFLASLVFYLVPFKVFALVAGFYYLRHPRFRGDMPSVPVNFFRRLPSLSDQIL
ncbi:hypothetical protein DM860_010675 [Cuscuta australis]|uniref:C2 domain-containing protein n=1 Tax=Cuscuta australis TaxID=267555 RepID=A0A328E239_9ASTE|nr:hypothetical protein DM860_010675 [Cuscuta australis]